MAMGNWRAERQPPLWVATSELAAPPGHPFYQQVNEVLRKHGFDRFVEGLCQKFYAPKMGRPSIPPGVYFRMLLIGYFEGIDSERGIAWRAADSIALRHFLGYDLTERPPDHSTLSRTRRLLDLETHQEVFIWVLAVLAKEGVLKGKTLGVDATTLEANAALRSVVRRETGESYNEFLERLAKASGIETPRRADLAKLDRKRPGKGSNDDWEHPHDPEAEVTKMKDGRTHLAHKAEHAVDLDTGVIVAVTVQPADVGDTTSIDETVAETFETLLDVREQGGEVALPKEIVADKGYHSNDVMTELSGMGIRSYVSEPDRGRRNWQGKAAERAAGYGNRRRIRGRRGKSLMRKRAEKVERSFAHCYGTGGMRRTHLRGHPKILKRLLLHASAFNLGLVMRKLFGLGTPRSLAERLAGLSAGISGLLWRLRRLLRAIGRPERPFGPVWLGRPPTPAMSLVA